MASEAVFDQHPLGDYLREAGEFDSDDPDEEPLVPGALSRHRHTEVAASEWINELLNSIQALLSDKRRRHRPQATPFIEQLKYLVISSSLLSHSLSPSSSTTSRAMPTKMTQSAKSYEERHEQVSRRISSSSYSSSSVVTASTEEVGEDQSSSWWNVLPVLLVLPFSWLIALAGCAVVYFKFNVWKDEHEEVEEVVGVHPTLEALNELILASDVWDSVVHDAIVAVEDEEERMSPTFFQPPSPTTSSLRLTLHTSLHSTQTQCDNVRALFGALTREEEVSQIRDMYKPPSPSPRPFHVRPRSLPLRKPTMTSRDAKRSTWAGSGSSPRVRKRTSDVFTEHKSLVQVTESDDEGQEVEISQRTLLSPPISPSFMYNSNPNSPSFGSAALKLTSPSTHSLSSPRHVRNLLTLPALHDALEHAISAKRYACSHLLALQEGEDEAYWEDVGSVIGLLASTFSDAAGRLRDALSTNSPVEKTKSSETSFVNSLKEEIGFAPMPSRYMRFTAHVDAISGALSHARDELGVCVSALANSNEEQGDKALEAYERLRRELGFALRECERGRERLVGLVRPPPVVVEEELVISEVTEEISVREEIHTPTPQPLEPIPEPEPEPEAEIDEMTLLTAQTQTREQIFESDVFVAPFTRPKTTMSREERILAAKAKRTSVSLPSSPEEKWTRPGGEVVQELKDVIWRVGERRRRLVEEEDEDEPLLPPGLTPPPALKLEIG